MIDPLFTYVFIGWLLAMNRFHGYVYVINGFYDILCGISILTKVDVPILSKLHISMFKYEENEITHRFFGYWICTYGIMRLSNDEKVVLSSYVLESIFLLNEYRRNRMKKSKVYFSILGCMILLYNGLVYKK